MTLLTYLYLAALLAVTVIACHNPDFSARRWFLAVYCALRICQTIFVLSLADTEAFRRHVWMPVEMTALPCGLVAVGLAFFGETEPLAALRRFGLRFGASLVPIALVGLAWANVSHNDPYWVFLSLRNALWEWAAVALGIVMRLVPHKPHRDTWLLVTLAAAHGVFGPMTASPEMRYYAGICFKITVILACVSWLLGSASGPECPPARSERHS